jgi:hypothetical protein
MTNPLTGRLHATTGAIAFRVTSGERIPAPPVVAETAAPRSKKTVPPLSQCAVILVWTGLSVSLSPPLTAKVADTSTSQALRFFAETALGDSDAVMRALRPTPPSASQLIRALATLPEQGELIPTSSEVSKIRALDPILQYHERRGVYAIKVIDTPQIAIALHARAVLLLSRTALQTLSASEVRAMVAHEIGHEYFWPEYERFTRERDPRARRVLELKCDGIAGLTLVALNLDLSSLHNGIRTMTDFNAQLGATAGADGYPSLRERRTFIETLLKDFQRRRAAW